VVAVSQVSRQDMVGQCTSLHGVLSFSSQPRAQDQCLQHLLFGGGGVWMTGCASYVSVSQAVLAGTSRKGAYLGVVSARELVHRWLLLRLRVQVGAV
jgi:hypothetical protein